MLNPEKPLFYTIPEAAKLLKINEQTAYRMARDGEIETVKVGNRLKRVSAAWLHRLMAGEAA